MMEHKHDWEKGYWARCDICDTVVEGDNESSRRVVILKVGGDLMVVEPSEVLATGEIVAEGYGAECGVLVVRGDDGKHYVIHHERDGARLVAVLDNWFSQ